VSVSRLQTVAIIGAGVLGRQLAFLSARAGYKTVLEDVLPSKLRKAEQHFEQLQPDDADALAISYASSIEDAVREADLMIDCVPDELESKLEIFSLLDRMAPPRAIIGTPTRVLSIADLASCTYRPERCVGFRLPDSLLRSGEITGEMAVDLVRTSFTSGEVIDAVRQFWRDLGLQINVTNDPAEIFQIPPASSKT
jgi:3-hydroxybutyryl-CoA dehydrogenase